YDLEVVRITVGWGRVAERPQTEFFQPGPVGFNVPEGIERVLNSLRRPHGFCPAGVVIPAGFGNEYRFVAGFLAGHDFVEQFGAPEIEPVEGGFCFGWLSEAIGMDSKGIKKVAPSGLV